ncbi:MAG: DUF2891 domain-containing protein [Proteobacteria bacterium]|nr:DUF2891 domain-containing protein [Pseudomonadota bacterium]
MLAQDFDDISSQLTDMLLKDQQYRSLINNLEEDQAGNSIELGSLRLKQQQNDSENIKQLDSIIKQIGKWPTVSMVGENAAASAYLIFQHAPIETQKKMLSLIKKATLNGEFKAEWFALLQDRLLMNQNKRQLYGTQLTLNKDTGKYDLYPIENESDIDKKRQEIGLETLTKYISNWDLLYQKPIHPNESTVLIEYPIFGKFADLALTCLHQEYPNSIKHVMLSDLDAKTPQQLHPAFYGCFDWHSSVHGHWLLTRVARLFPNNPKTKLIKIALARNITPENIAIEVEYFKQKGRSSYVRPYGYIWLLQLASELRGWQDEDAKIWSKTLEPLELLILQRFKQWLPKLAYPIRVGEHSQTAFSFGMALDYARQNNRSEFENRLVQKVKLFYQKDKKCPIHYEPSGHDFLSACLAEADLMRRVLPKKQFSKWLKKFLPGIRKGSKWLPVTTVTDRVDLKLAHLDGLNISRAWMLEGIAQALPADDKRTVILLNLAYRHSLAGLRSVTGKHYAGGHWLGSFATYLVSRRGIN